MKQAVKTIVTILVAIVCCFASLIAFGFYLAEVNSIEYDAERLVSPEIDVVNVTPLGNDYEGTIKEGFAYYLIEMSVDNKSNYGLESYDVSLYYEAEQDDYYYYVSRVDDQYTFTRWDNGYYIPPGKVGTAFQVICVEDACKEITIIYKNYKTDEEKRIPVNL